MLSPWKLIFYVGACVGVKDIVTAANDCPELTSIGLLLQPTLEQSIQFTVVDIRGDKVRLGIDAPQEIPVHRQEVYDAIKRENQKASRLGPKETRDLGK